MKVESNRNNSKVEIEFSHDNEKLVIDFSLESMRAMRFIEAAMRASKVRNEEKRTMAYVEVMGRAIDMIGEESFEDLEYFYEDAGEELTVTDFIGAIMGAFGEEEELPKE